MRKLSPKSFRSLCTRLFSFWIRHSSGSPFALCIPFLASSTLYFAKTSSTICPPQFFPQNEPTDVSTRDAVNWEITLRHMGVNFFLESTAVDRAHQWLRCRQPWTQMQGVAVLRLPRRAGPNEHGCRHELEEWHGGKTWHRTIYDEIRFAPAEHSALPTEAPLGTKAKRELMTQTVFATFHVSAMHTAQTLLNISGCTTDIAMDSGDGVSHRVPVYESFTLHHAIFRLAGRSFSEYLMTNFIERGFSFTASAEREMARDVTEKLCLHWFVITTQNSNRMRNFYEEETDELPNGNINSRVRCVESVVAAKFHPQRSQRFLRHSFPERHEVRRVHPQRVVLSWCQVDTAIFLRKVDSEF